MSVEDRQRKKVHNFLQNNIHTFIDEQQSINLRYTACTTKEGNTGIFDTNMYNIQRCVL